MTETRKLQLTQLKILKKVAKICQTHNIRYYLDGGTLLGAARHKGFIPWDDDVDIVMPYADYLRFCDICKRELDSTKYFLQTMETDSYYTNIFAKFRLQNTLHIRKGHEHMKFHQGIYIDIFPLCPVPANVLLNFIFKFIVTKLKTIMWSPIGAGGTYRKRWYKLLSLIPTRLPYRLIFFLVSLCKGKYLWSIGMPQYTIKTELGRQKHVNEPTADILENIQVRAATELEFEGEKFPVPANYEYILTYMYGDYMQLPPEEERIGHHTPSRLDFGEYQ